MKILYAVHQFFPDHITGTERFTLNLAKAMRRVAHRPEVFTYQFTSPSPAKNILENKYVYDGIPVTSFHYTKEPWDINLSLRGPSAAYGYAESFLKKNRFDLIHVTHLMRLGFLVATAAKFNIPYVITLTDYFITCYQGQLLNTRKEICEGPDQGKRCARSCRFLKSDENFLASRFAQAREILKKARHVVSPSRFLADKVRIDFPEIPIRIIPFGSFQRPMTIKKNYTKKSKIIFSIMGLVAFHKGVHVLVKAFRRVKNPRIRLKIYGPTVKSKDPYVNEQYLDFIRYLSSGDSRISIEGPYRSEDSLSQIFRVTDVLCFPSVWHETFGIIVEEALAARVPVLASRVGAAPERVRDGVNGFTYPHYDEVALAKLIEKIGADPTLLSKLRANMLDYCTDDEEAAQYETLYRTIN